MSIHCKRRARPADGWNGLSEQQFSRERRGGADEAALEQKGFQSFMK